jgi:hypothetical protein
LLFVGVSIKIQLIRLFSKAKVSIIEINLFNNNSRDPAEVRYGRSSTRLYLILLIGALTVLILYTSIAVHTIHTTIASPSQEQYEELELQYPNTLQCPCTVVTIPYKEFIHVAPVYHQLCESDFIQPFWYESFPFSEYGQFASILFVGSSHFRTLATLCDLANLTIVDENRRFSSTMLINAQAVSRNLFSSKADAIIDKFLDSTRAKFSNIMLLINTVIHVNQYITGLGTNSEVFIEATYPLLEPSGLNRSRIIVYSRNSFVGDRYMYCAQNASCDFTKLLGDSNDIIAEGLRTDCWVVNSVLESTLSCWYNDSCIDRFRKILAADDFPLNTNVTVLDIMRPSRF